MTFGPYKICDFSDSFKMDKVICHLNDIWSRHILSLFLYVYPLRDSVYPAYTVSELNLDCLPMLNISLQNDR